MALWAEQQLGHGFRAEIWTEAELAPVHSFLDSPFWKWCRIAMVPILVVFMLFSWKNGALAYFLVFPVLTAVRMQRLLNPSESVSGRLLDWQDSKPLQSEHWGQSPHA